jgi:hypothetical protein
MSQHKRALTLSDLAELAELSAGAHDTLVRLSVPPPAHA